MTIDPERPPWLVRFARTRDADPVGAGMLIDERHVLTCAHVVHPRPPAEPPREPLYVTFQFLPPHEPLAARVADGGWHPGAERRGDVAILTLDEPLPAGALAAPLRTTIGEIYDHRFFAYGYTDLHRRGTSTMGVITGRAGDEEWLQLTADHAHGQPLEKGFSGCPVWDRTVPGVVGIVVTREKIVGGVDTRIGFGIPVEALARYWPPLGDLIRETVTIDREAERERLEELLDLSLDVNGELPLVAEIGPYDVGVTPSKYVSDGTPDPEYVPRTRVDEELDVALADKPFLLLTGDSTAGKSRTMFELLRRRRPGARLIVPIAGSSALQGLTRVPLPLDGGPAVLWLDDLNRFLGPQGLDTKVLDHCARHDPPITVVATITRVRLNEALAAQGEPGRMAKRVLVRAHEVRLDTRLERDDEAHARRLLYSDDDLGGRGFGEQLVAGPAVRNTYEGARDKAPAAWAVMRAATDWARIGMDAPVPEHVLRALFERYHQSEFDAAPDSEDFAAGLVTAQRFVAESIRIAPLRRADGAEPAYLAFPFLRAYLDGETGEPAEAIPDFTWECAVESLAPAGLLNLAWAAQTRGRLGAAEAALRRAFASQDDARSAAWAALLLGELLELTDPDSDEALSAFQAAAGSGIPAVAPLADIDLARRAIHTGDAERAIELYEAARASGHPVATALAAVSLGGLLADRGDIAAAKALLEPIVRSGDPNMSPAAMAHYAGLVTGSGGEARKPSLGGSAPVPEEAGNAFDQVVGERAIAQVVPVGLINLGRLEALQGERAEARRLLQAAIDSGEPTVFAVAHANLAWVLIDDGEIDAARAHLEVARESGHPTAAPSASVSLALLLIQEGDTEAARALLEPVATAGPSDSAPRAGDLLGDLLAAAGDTEGAMAAYERAIASGHGEWAPIASIDLATLAANHGDPDRARELLEAAANSAHPHQAPRAADLLGDLLALQGNAEAAEAAYRRAIAGKHPDWAPIAQIDLAIMLAETRPAEARRLLEGVATSEHPHQRPRALEVLGEFHAAQREPAAAREAFERAIATGHPEWAPIARINLAELVADAGDLDAGAELLIAAQGASNPVVVAYADLYLGVVRAEQGDADAAREQFAAAERSGPPDVVALASYQLARLDVRNHDYDAATVRLEALRDGNEGVRRLAESYLDVVGTLRGQGGAAGAELVRQGEELFEAGDLDVAAEVLTAALESGEAESHPRARALLGAVRLALGEFDEAREQLEAALAAGDADAEPIARRNLGSVLIQLGRHEEARDVLMPLADDEQSPERPAALVLLGQLAALDRAVQDARRWFEAALATGDEDAAIAARAGLSELPAAPLVEVSAEPAPKRPEPGAALAPSVLVLVGEVALAEGDEDDARWWLERAVESADTAAAARASTVLAGHYSGSAS